MKTPNRLFVASLSMLLSVATLPAFDIASFGEARAVVVTGKDPSPVVATMAAELTNYLDRIVVGAKFQVSARPVGGKNTIRLGAPYQGKDDESAVFVNKRGELELTGMPPRGTVYATYAFLEELGCRFWAPDQETVPTAKKLSLPGNFRRVESPAFEVRNANGESARDARWCAKLRLNMADMELPETLGGSRRVSMNHSLSFTLVRKDDFYLKHPDWFAYRPRPKGPDGKPVAPQPNGWCTGGDPDRSPWQLCLTNPEVLTQLVVEVRAKLAKDPAQEISLVMADNSLYCQCERCQRLVKQNGGRNSAPTMRAANIVARAVAKDYPKARFTFLAYDGTLWPPTKIKCEPSIRIGLAYLSNGPVYADPAFLKILSEWRAYTKNPMYVWGYYALFQDFVCPWQNFDFMGPDFRLYKKSGVTAVQCQLNWGRLGDFVDLRCWLLAKLAWNPDQDEDKLIREWIDGTCGKGAPFMREYYDLRLAQRERTKNVGYGGQDCLYLPAPALFDKALAATADEPAAHSRIERLSAGVLSVLILHYDDKPMVAEAKRLKLTRPPREELFKRFEALTKKYNQGTCLWTESNWECYPSLLDRMKARMQGR